MLVVFARRNHSTYFGLSVILLFVIKFRDGFATKRLGRWTYYIKRPWVQLKVRVQTESYGSTTRFPIVDNQYGLDIGLSSTSARVE